MAAPNHANLGWHEEEIYCRLDAGFPNLLERPNCFGG
jgi:hypothetical protein